MKIKTKLGNNEYNLDVAVHRHIESLTKKMAELKEIIAIRKKAGIVLAGKLKEQAGVIQSQEEKIDGFVAYLKKHKEAIIEMETVFHEKADTKELDKLITPDVKETN